MTVTVQERSPAPPTAEPALLQLATGMWSTCAVAARSAVAALLASAASAARLDLWPTSTGPAHGLNESQTYAAGEERIGCGPGRRCRPPSAARSRGHFLWMPLVATGWLI